MMSKVIGIGIAVYYVKPHAWVFVLTTAQLAVLQLVLLYVEVTVRVLVVDLVVMGAQEIAEVL